MKIEGTGPMCLVVSDDEDIRGIWVDRVDRAQLNDSFKSELRAFLAMVQARGMRKIPVEVYAAVAEGDFRIVENSPGGGGGFLLMLNTGPGSVYATVRSAPEQTAPASGGSQPAPGRPSIWKRMFGAAKDKRKVGARPTQTRNEVKLSISEINKVVFAILMHVTKPRGLSNAHDVDFFIARCDACGMEFPSKELSRMAGRIQMRTMGAGSMTVVGGADVYACPQCKCGTAVVVLRGMTEAEIEMVRGEL